MRPISAALAAVQQVRAPQARVQVTVSPRGQNPALPALAWQELVENTGQTDFRPTTAVGRSDGSLLKIVAAATTITRTIIADPTDPAAWTAATPVTLRSHSALAVAALRVPGSTTIRLFFIYTNNNIYSIHSNNDGGTWTTPVAVYTGGDAAGDLVVSYLDDGVIADGPWFVGFSAYDAGSGVYHPRFGMQTGGVWTFTPYSSGWRAAGIDAYAPPSAALRVLVFRQSGQGASRLRMLELDAGAYANPQDLDQTQGGRFGVILGFYRFSQVPEAACMAGVVCEAAEGYGSYVGVSGLFTRMDAATHSAADDRQVDEPLIFPAIVHPRDQAALCVAAAGDDLYLVGDTVVYRGARQPASAATLVPIRYRYDDHQMDIEFAADAEIDHPIQVGQVLTVTRTLAWDGQSGSESIAVWVVRVERGLARLRVLAVDGVGYLGLMRCRRPAILNDGSATGLAQVMRRLAARAGLPLAVDDSTLETAPVLPLTVQPNESLRGAAHRVTAQTSAFLVPRNDGAFGVTLIRPPYSDRSGHYQDTPHAYGVAPSCQPLIDAVAVSDARRLAFSYVLGAYSTDPEDGAALAMAAGPVLPNTRPLSYSLTNMRYNTWARVALAAAAEAARQHALPISAEIDAVANLALEVMDVVEVTEPALGWTARRLRVRRIAETWERGRLLQHIWLGDV